MAGPLLNPAHARPARVQQVRAVKAAIVGTLVVCVAATLLNANSGFLVRSTSGALGRGAEASAPVVVDVGAVERELEAAGDEDEGTPEVFTEREMEEKASRSLPRGADDRPSEDLTEEVPRAPSEGEETAMNATAPPARRAGKIVTADRSSPRSTQHLAAPPPRPPPMPPPLNPFTSHPLPPPDFDNLDIVRRLAANFRSRCEVLNGYFQAAGARYHRMKENGVIVIDWSENYFNGIGDEMQHYQEMLAIGLVTGRAAYIKTQKAGCVGSGLAGATDPFEAEGGAEHLAKACHFDMGDYYSGIHGVDWKWDNAKEARVREQLGEEEKELVVTWSERGMYFGDSAKPFEIASPTGEYVAPPDANLIKVLMENDVFKKRKLVRVRVKLNFGHWCHEHQKGSWGMCESYRWAAGIERHKRNELCPDCQLGGCFGAAMLQPRLPLKRKLAPYIAKIEEKKWSTVVGFHIRVGFADMSQVAPPDVERVEEATVASIDAFLKSEAARVPYPAPTCPDKQLSNGEKDVLSDVSPDDGPLAIFLKCVVSTAKVLAERHLGGGGRGGGGDPGAWGVFMTTDSPAVRTAVETQFPALEGRVIVTEGAYGNVKFSNTGVCTGDSTGSDCDASDPRGAWEKSMMDMYLVGLSDVVLMLYQSKFTNAAIMRADVPHGIRQVYVDTRITHSLVDTLVSKMIHGGFKRAAKNDQEVWVKLWDLFGPAGERKALRTSQFSSKHL